MKKILLIGLGGFGKNHLRVLNELNRNNFELFACDLNSNNLDSCQTYNMQKTNYSTNYLDYLDLVDAVDIATPTDSHFELCKIFLEKGKDVFVEKPFTINSFQAQELINLAKENNCILQVGHMHRYNPAVNFAKNEINNGNLGEILYIYGHFMGFKRMRNDVGVAHTDSIHYFDTADYLIGNKPDSVQAISKDVMKRGLEDISVVFLNYGNVLVQIESGYFAPGKWRDLTIVGSKQTIVMDIIKQTVLVYYNYFERINEKIVPIKNGLSSPEIKFEEPLKLEIKDYLHCIETRKEPVANAESGLNMIKVVEGVEHSSKLNKKISLE